MTKAILVTGATGNQGGTVLEALVKQASDHFVIIALTRDATSPIAKHMSTQSKCVHILQGNMDNPDQVFSEAERMIGAPIWDVFMVQVCSFLDFAEHQLMLDSLSLLVELQQLKKKLKARLSSMPAQATMSKC